MNKIKLQVDTVNYNSKPKDFGNIKARVQQSDPLELTLQEIIEKIEQGYTISPGILCGGLGAAN